MDFFRKLFGRAAPVQPIRLAAGRGYTFKIEGESAYQPALDRMCGGKCENGHKKRVTAELRIADSLTDAVAVEILIDAQRVGYVGGPLGALLWREIVLLSEEERPIVCEAQIVGGWRHEDGEGHYGVKLNLSSPLRVAT